MNPEGIDLPQVVREIYGVEKMKHELLMHVSIITADY